MAKGKTTIQGGRRTRTGTTIGGNKYSASREKSWGSPVKEIKITKTTGESIERKKLGRHTESTTKRGKTPGGRKYSVKTEDTGGRTTKIFDPGNKQPSYTQQSYSINGKLVGKSGKSKYKGKLTEENRVESGPVKKK